MPDDIQKVKSQSSIENPVDLDHHLPSAIKILGGRLGIHAVRFSASKYGMGLREWRIIHILGCDGPSTISEVAERLAMDQGGTSRSIAKLESRGMLVRRSDASDRRLSRVELSTAGQHTHNEIMKL